jgi:hypothetical protein
MTGLYLEKLRALTSKKGVGEAPSKPSKHSFESFEGAQGRAFSNFPAGYSRTMAALEARCPDLVLVDRWQAAIEDGRRFLARWGDQGGRSAGPHATCSGSIRRRQSRTRATAGCPATTRPA